MFEFSDSTVEVLADGKFCRPLRSFAQESTNSVVVDPFLKRKSNINLGRFDDGVRPDLSQKITSLLACDIPDELSAMFRVSLAVVVDVESAAEGFVKIDDNGSVRHADPRENVVSDVRAVGFLPSIDADVTLAVKQTGSVNNIHASLHGTKEKLANSVDTQNGQYRAKQEPKAPGVCNEHVPTAKAKMCSELRRNTENSSEMSESVDVGTDYKLHQLVTDCNTNYLHWRPHADRNMVPIGGERMAVNQDAIVKLIGWAGNLTCSGARYQGLLSD